MAYASLKTGTNDGLRISALILFLPAEGPEAPGPGLLIHLSPLACELQVKLNLQPPGRALVGTAYSVGLAITALGTAQLAAPEGRCPGPRRP